MAACTRRLGYMVKNTSKMQLRRTLLSCSTCKSERKPHGYVPVVSHGSSRRKMSELAAPQPDDSPKQYPDHIKRIVDDISKLTILEVSELNQLLKKTLNIEDVPMMAMGAMAAAPAPVEEEQEAAPEPTEFTVKLTGFADNAKVKLIREIKALMPGMNLVQAKKFVEGVPQIVKEKTSKEEADAVQKALEAVGGTIEIET